MANLPAPTSYSLGASGVQMFKKTEQEYITALVNRVNSVSNNAGAVIADTISPTLSTTLVKVSGVGLPKITGSAATVTLTTAQSGSMVYFDSAAGIIYTLPAATVANIGVAYTFFVSVTATSNNHSIYAASSSDLMYGSVDVNKAGTLSKFATNNSSNYKVVQNGTTTGGIVGTFIYVECLGLNAWQVTGTQVSSGTVATPFVG